MTFQYVRQPSEFLNAEAAEKSSALVNAALAQLEGGKYEKMSAADLVQWFRDNRQATYTHLMKGLLAWEKEHKKAE